MRADALGKLFALTRAVASVDDVASLTIEGSTSEALKALEASQDAMNKLLQAQRPNFADINMAWWADITTCEKCSAVAAEARAAAVSKWSKLVVSVSQQLMEIAPAVSLVSNPKLCVLKDLQDCLFNNPKKQELSDLLENLSEKLRLWRNTSVAGVVDLPEKTYQAGIRAKAHGRLSTGVEWALRKLVKEVPTDAKNLPAHGQMIKDKVIRKGVNLPLFLMNVIEELCKVQVQPEDNSKPDPEKSAGSCKTPSDNSKVQVAAAVSVSGEVSGPAKKKLKKRH